MKIVIDSAIPYVKGVFEPFARVAYIPGKEISPADVCDADALVVRTRTRCDEALLVGSQVRFIASATIGFDHIDTAWCAARGIGVSIAKGCNARAVLQWVGAALVCASRVQGWSLAEKTLGVVGVGSVGSLVAEYGAAWGFRVVCCDPPRQRAGEKDPSGNDFTDLSAIARQADIVTFHVPLARAGADVTYHMAGEEFFASAPGNLLLLNSSRGEVVDTQALLAAMEETNVSCCIDTWESEPDINRRLLAESLLATPHVAGYSAQGKANASAMSVRAVAAHLGLPLRDWYPPEVARVKPRSIDWDEMKAGIGGYFDITAESDALKRHPGQFEQMRDTYRYRTEYF